MRTIEQRVAFIEDALEQLAYEVYEIRQGQDQSTHEWIDNSDQTAYAIWSKIQLFRRSLATFDDED